MTVAFFVSVLSFREAGGRPLLFYREECNFQFRESVHTVVSIILGERKSSSRFIGPEDRLRQRAQSVHSLSCLANILSIPDTGPKSEESLRQGTRAMAKFVCEHTPRYATAVGPLFWSLSRRARAKRNPLGKKRDSSPAFSVLDSHEVPGGCIQWPA